MEKYRDIINLPHHISKKRPQMDMEHRAMQFSPYAALTGFGDVINETARLTDGEASLDENAAEYVNRALNMLAQTVNTRPRAEITYFQPDAKKDGGKYVTINGNVKKVDMYARKLIMEDGKEINIDSILYIQSDSQDSPIL